MIRDILVQFQAPMQNPPVFVYGNSAAFSTATGSVSLSSTQAGDYVLAVISSTSAAIQVPAGYQLISSSSQTADSIVVYAAVIGRRLTVPVTSLQVTQGGTASVTAQVFRGVSASEPIGIPPVYSGSFKLPDSPETPVPVPNSIVVSLCAVRGDPSKMTAGPDGYTNMNYGVIPVSGYRLISCAASAVKTSGPENPGTWHGGSVVSPATVRSVAFTVVLNPE